jgi:hypothetical protein
MHVTKQYVSFRMACNRILNKVLIVDLFDPVEFR